MELMNDLAGLVIKHTPELLVGAIGYNIRKYFGEQITRYVFSPIWKRVNKYLIIPVWKLVRSRIGITEREAAIWLHRRNRHRADSPLLCSEGECRLYRVR